MTIDRERVLAVLRAKRGEIESRYGLRMVGLVGSVARGEATDTSDVDVMVDIVGMPSLFDLSRAERELEASIGLGLPVEVVPRKGLRPEFRDYIERDLIPL